MSARTQALIDSCHCQQGSEPSPCDGWLQHRKCDSLADAIAMNSLLPYDEAQRRNLARDKAADRRAAQQAYLDSLGVLAQRVHEFYLELERLKAQATELRQYREDNL